MVFLSGLTSGRQEPCGGSKDLIRCGTGMCAFHVDCRRLAGNQQVHANARPLRSFSRKCQ